MTLLIGSKIRIIDTSGGRSAKCITIYKKNSSFLVGIGSILMVSIKAYQKHRFVRRGELHKGVIVRDNNRFGIFGGHIGKCDTNALILLKANGDIMAKRIASVISHRLRIYGFTRALSISNRIY